ncbi:MAG: xanthine dehydrogenase family protein molybdopterin-binding subunit [Desulfobacterales bacterium]|nr:xanthine dehydrogenase family protein molybdopterin-binding subunit [Desulfobacterales bacterium]
MKRDFVNIGTRLPRIDGIIKATGEARYGADLSLPGMLSGKILRSPHPHARILGIDTRRAAQLPGVRAVVTGKDTTGFKGGGIGSNGDEPYLAMEKVRFIGDDVAAVAAIDEEIAEEALDLIQVEYEMLPTVDDPVAAMGPESPLLHDHAPRNISLQTDLAYGDVDEAFKKCDYVREDRFETAPIRHAFLEPHAALASWDQSGKLSFWGSKQSPYFTYRNMAKAFGIALNRVRVVQPYIGGGFGGKNEMFGVDFCAALLSRRTGKPVKIVVSQEEVLYAFRQRHPTVIDIKTGLKKDGTLMALEADIVADGGAYLSIGAMSLYLMCAFLCVPYRLPNMRTRGRRVYTNTQPSCAMRGHGVPQSRFAAEVQLDLAAKEMGLDPMDVRLKNALKPGETTPNGFKITSCGLEESLVKGKQTMARWIKERPRQTDGKIKRGIGVGCYGFVVGPRLAGHNTAAAVVKVHEDGGVSLMTGSTDCGQGSDTVMCQIAAEVLGVRMEDIQYNMVDSDVTPVDPGTYGSRVTFITGNAVRVAAEDVRDQLAQVAAGALEANPKDIVFRDRQVFVAGSQQRGMPFSRLVKTAQYSGIGKTLIGRGYWSPKGIDVVDFKTGRGNISATYSFGTQIAEVELDTTSGRIRVTRMAALHDGGQPLNTMAVEGQLEGALIAAVGHTLSEEIIRQDGQTMNPSFLEYKLPTTLDVCDVEIVHTDVYDDQGPFGAKECGEGIQVAVVPAIVNALYDATGVSFKRIPVTPDRVLEALGKKTRGLE